VDLKGLERLGNPIIPECILGMSTNVYDTNILKLGSGRTNASPTVMYCNTNVDVWLRICGLITTLKKKQLKENYVAFFD
jgi:hypothetical protein